MMLNDIEVGIFVTKLCFLENGLVNVTFWHASGIEGKASAVFTALPRSSGCSALIVKDSCGHGMQTNNAAKKAVARFPALAFPYAPEQELQVYRA